MAKKPNALKGLETAVTGLIKKAQEEAVFSEYKFKFRASGLPFCPRELVIDRLIKEENRVGSLMDYGFAFYVGIGTAVHEVIQRYLGMVKGLYGNWTCCGYTELEREGSKECPVCGEPQHYDEFKMSFGDSSAYADGVWLRHNAVWEFKTYGVDKVDDLTEPKDAHLQQASCYVELLNEARGWNIDKIIFVYLARDNPRKFKVLVVPPIKNMYSTVLKEYREAQKMAEAKILPKRVCESPTDGDFMNCGYSGICFSPDLDKMLIPVESLVR
tara:strand:+ start:148036 stop:148848 length:813 start_codon:yes stop_codon:yes gene_type:complete